MPVRVVSEPMQTRAQTTEPDYYTRAANDDYINGRSRTRTKYAYDEAGHLLGEYDGSGNLIEETVWLGDIPVATLQPSGTSVAIYYVHTDQLNTPRQITRPSDNVQMWTWFSDPFGTDAANANPAGAGAFAYNLRFPGQIFDGQAGLHYNYRRDLDPVTGRYVESDPIGLRGGANTYAYVGDAPLTWSDPYGLRPWDWDGYGDTSVCQYYDDEAARTKCPYYTNAAQTCRNQRNDVKLLLLAGIADGWWRGTTTASESAIVNAIRNGLVNADKTARKAGQVGCDGCVKGDAIDAYHENVFIGAGINPFWYGGNQWPQGVPPNYVPYDPERKPRWDPRQLFH